MEQLILDYLEKKIEKVKEERKERLVPGLYSYGLERELDGVLTAYQTAQHDILKIIKENKS